VIEIKNGISLSVDDVNLIKTNSQEMYEGAIFIAINSGNRFVKQALESGAKYVICEHTECVDERVIVVENSLATFTQIARWYRDQINPKVIAITGSNGKTSVKDILALCLKDTFKVHKTAGNYNNHIGVPITVCSMPKECEILIAELGMSGFGEIDHLASIVKPDIGIITNIGESHLEMLKTKENVLKAKAEIISHSKKVVINSDDMYLASLNGEFLKFSIKIPSDFMALNIEKKSGMTVFELLSGERVETNLMGTHNVYNILAALRVCKELGILDISKLEILKSLEISKMRMEKSLYRGAQIINDAYNASPKSTSAAIETVCEYYPNQEKIFILGDMLELGEQECEFHREIIEKVAQLNIKRVYFYGERYYQFYQEFESDTLKFSLEKHWIQDELNAVVNENSVVLLKGSRGMKLEEILK